MSTNVNPLRQFFRQPAIYLKLPSNGDHWAPGTLKSVPNNEYPVLPMTAIDEITYRTPDALFNGEAVVSVIKSCMPSVVNPWAAPSVDVNAILVGIRIASYGHELEVGTTCPKCATVDEYALDLRSVLDQIRMPNYSQTVTYGDLEISFKPLDYQTQNSINMAQFEQQRLIQMIPNSELADEEKVQRLNEAVQKITELTVTTIKHSIGTVRTPQALVTEPEFIEEFLNNCDRKLFKILKDQVIALRQETDLRPMLIKCDNCGHEYEQPVTLDMASFFDFAS